VSDGQEKSRAELGSKWGCRQSDERCLTVDEWRAFYDWVAMLVHVNDRSSTGDNV